MRPILHTETFGEGTPVVLLHGWGMNMQIWPKALLQSIKAQWILVDLPGHGKSSHIPLSENLDSVLDLLEQVIPNDAIIIGWSLGGMFTLALQQRFAMQKPVRGRQFGLISSSPKFVSSSNWRFATKPATLNVFAKNLVDNSAQTIKRFIALQFMNVENAKPSILAIQKSVLASPPDTASLLIGLHYLQTLDLRQHCQQISQPVVGFFGRLDGLVPIKATANIESCFTDGQFTTITSEKSGHAPFLTDPELFKQFLHQVIYL